HKPLFGVPSTQGAPQERRPVGFEVKRLRRKEEGCSAISFNAAEDGPEVFWPGGVGAGEAGGAEVGELGGDCFVAVVARFFGLAEVGDVAVDPAEAGGVEGGWDGTR